MVVLSGCSEVDAVDPAKINTGESSAEPIELSRLEREAQKLLNGARLSKREMLAAEASVKKALQDYLFDPGSAQLADVRLGRNGGVCGKVNAKNRLGAYVGYRDFVLQKDKRIFVSDRNDGIASLEVSSFASAYLSHCASNAEARAYNEIPGDFEPAPTVPSEDNSEEPDHVLDAPLPDLSDLPEEEEKPPIT